MKITKIYLATEYHLKRIEFQGCRAEFVILDMDKNFVEVIEAMKDNPEKAIFQCVAYLAMNKLNAERQNRPIQRPLWGVCTNFKTFGYS